MFRFLAFAGAMMLALAAPAFAQTTTIEGASIFGALKPYITELVGIFVAGVLGYLATLVKAKFGLDIEAKHREALQTALTNAAGLLIAKGDGLAAGINFDVKNPIVAEAVNYALKGAPDAMKYFGLTPERVRDMLAAKVGVVIAVAPNG